MNDKIKFIICSSLESFNKSYTLGKIAKSNLIFIEDTKLIWTNDVFYATKDFDEGVVQKLISISDTIITNGDGNMVLTDKGIYVNKNQLGNTTVGSNINPVYFKEGLALASSSTVGTPYKPIFLNLGNITSCEDTLNVNINGYVVRNNGNNKVGTLTALPIDKSLIVASLEDATNITLSSDMNVGETITIIATSKKDFILPLPNTGNWISMDGDSLDIKSNKKFEINIYCYDDLDGKMYSISCKIMK